MPPHSVQYSEEIADELLFRLASSARSIHRICAEDDDMPAEASFYRWLFRYPDLREKYARAKELQCTAIAEGIRDIAADGRNDWMQRLAFNGGNPSWEINGEAINRSRLRVDTEKWLLSKLLPKKYGDRIEQRVADADGNKLESIVVQFVRPGVETAASPAGPAGKAGKDGR